MAGFSRLYCIGDLGGFQGADGINPILFQIWVGDADRQWLEVHYFDHSINPLGAITKIVPEGPNHPNALLDACICFYPQHFHTCPSMPKISQSLQGVKKLDFDLGQANIPKEWSHLRQEAIPLFRQLTIFEGILEPLKLREEVVE